MNKSIDSSSVNKFLDKLYDMSINGYVGFDSANKIANHYMYKDGCGKTGDDSDIIENLIRWQAVKSGSIGFVSGLGGAITMPIAIPAAIIGTMQLQIRMIAAIAHIRGYDVHDDRVKSFVMACICGKSVTDLFKEAGIMIGKKLTEQSIKRISTEVLVHINRTVGFRMLTKFGKTGAVNLGKAVPLVGGIIGMVFESTTTYTVGSVANDLFVLRT